MDPTPRLREGLLGHFWVCEEAAKGPLKDDDAVPGSLRLVDDQVVVRTLGADPSEAFVERAAPDRRWLFGDTEAGTVIVPALSGEHHQLSMFRPRSSVRTLRGPAVMAGVAEPFGPRVTHLLTKLPHPEWANLDPLAQTGHFDSRQRWQGLDIELRGKGPVPCGRIGSIDLELEGGWNEDRGEADAHRSQIWTSLDVITRSKRPRDVDKHVRIARRIQDILGIAYDRHLTAYSIKVTHEGRSEDHDPAWLWHQALTGGDDRAQTRPDEPYFRLVDLGAPDTLTRWVRLAERYVEAAEAISQRNRITAPTARIMQLGAAIEKYVGQNTAEARHRNAKLAWTAKINRDDTHAAQLARHAGRAFTYFIGDPDAWGRGFTDAYNSMKHPRAAVGAERTPFFNLTAQLLLTCTLLDRAAGNHRPSRAMLADPRLRGLTEFAKTI